MHNSDNASNTVKAEYTFHSIVGSNFERNPDTIMACFSFKTKNAEAMGALGELQTSGMLLARFDLSNKLKFLEMTYDVMDTMNKLGELDGNKSGAIPVVPINLAMAMGGSAEPRLVVNFTKPNRISHANKAWRDMGEFKLHSDEAEGVPVVEFLTRGYGSADGARWSRVEERCVERLEVMLDEIKVGRASCTTILSYAESGGGGRGSIDVLFVTAIPLQDSAGVTHFLITGKSLCTEGALGQLAELRRSMN
jgi:hypothetical protein